MTLDAAGRLGAFDDEGINNIGSGTASPGLTASRVWALTRSTSMAATGTGRFHLTSVFTPVPRVQCVVLHRGTAMERHAPHFTPGTSFGRRKHRIFTALFRHDCTMGTPSFTALRNPHKLLAPKQIEYFAGLSAAAHWSASLGKVRDKH